MAQESQAALKYNSCMDFHNTESLIILVIVILACSRRTMQARLGTRSLTFEQTTDIVIGLGIVVTFLMTFLFLSRH